MFDVTAQITDDGKIADRRVVDRMREQLLFRFAGRECRIRITEPKRSPGQNRFYWGCRIGIIHQAMLVTGAAQQVNLDTGEVTTITPMDIHESLKRDYLPPRTVELFDEERILPPSTASLGVAEFTEYLLAIETDERVRRLLALAGLDWPTLEEWEADNGAIRSGKIYETA